MTQTRLSRLVPKRFTRLRSFLSDNSGVAAMEFAIIAPVLIGMYLGLAELSSALKSDRKISHSASVAGDLATQVEEIRAVDAEDLISAVLHVASLREGDQYAIIMETFERDSDGAVNSGGIIQYRSGSLDSFRYDPNEFDENLLPRGTGILAATVRFRYKPFGFKGSESGKSILPTQMDMEETFLLKPRISDVVQFGPDDRETTIDCTGKVDNVSCSETNHDKGGDGDEDEGGCENGRGNNGNDKCVGRSNG
ncbi:MAG: TadE/TadG family type IV pilus assembly protein [Litorimonas sp.]